MKYTERDRDASERNAKKKDRDTIRERERGRTDKSDNTIALVALNPQMQKPNMHQPH